ncbi:MerR family transcriptional regulator [Neobacillus drentensis]|uniref:MerR family transcriptional regulator n=1 Tax=Neobacillus drentensis TaxID=220684 RepID=UPI000825979D|nr:MerR family transcriptional regulator [Neobacillus drentensis]
MKTYTLKEVAKIINTTPGTLRHWEKDLVDLLEIPRSKQGARIYTDLEIEQLKEIKQLYDKKLTKESIRESMQKKLHPESKDVYELPQVSNEAFGSVEVQDSSKGSLEIFENEDVFESPIVSLEVLTDTVKPITIQDAIEAHQLFEAIDTLKQNFLSEVKDEIRTVVRKEVLEEVKKEIRNGTYTTVKSLSDSIYKSSENTKAEIHELSETLEKASVLSADSLQNLSNNIANVSIETSQEIYTLSKQLSETTEELSHYVDVTNNEISSLTEAMSKEREFFIEERNQYRQEVTQREIAFQQMLNSYRDVAATKEKKWWKFWT